MFQIKFDVQGQEVIIPLSEEDSSEELEPTSCETTKRVLVAKDSGLISDEAYHELRMSLPEDQRFALPPFSDVKQERNKRGKEKSANYQGSKDSKSFWGSLLI